MVMYAGESQDESRGEDDDDDDKSARPDDVSDDQRWS